MSEDMKRLATDLAERRRLAHTPRKGVSATCLGIAHLRCLLSSFSLALLSLSIALVAGCSREPEPEPIVDRMEDPVYVEQLKECIKVQQEVTARSGQILRELEAARAEDPESEKTKELEKRHAKISAELEKLRNVNMAIIRNRMNQEQADRAKAAERSKK